MPSIAQIYIRRMRFDDARQKLLREIEHHFIAGEKEVEVIHGIGEYILRRMVEAEVHKLDYVELDTSFHTNPGSVRLKLLSPDSSILARYKA